MTRRIILTNREELMVSSNLHKLWPTIFQGFARPTNSPPEWQIFCALAGGKRSRYSVLLGGKLLLLHWINFDHGLWRDWLYMQPKSCCNRVLASAFPPNLDAAILFFYLPACHRFCTRQKSNPKLILSWYRTRVYVFEKNVTHTFLQELYQNISIHQARYNQIYYERGCKLIWSTCVQTLPFWQNMR